MGRRGQSGDGRRKGDGKRSKRNDWTLPFLQNSRGRPCIRRKTKKPSIYRISAVYAVKILAGKNVVVRRVG